VTEQYVVPLEGGGAAHGVPVGAGKQQHWYARAAVQGALAQHCALLHGFFASSHGYFALSHP